MSEKRKARRQLRGEYTKEEQRMVDWVKKNQTCVELVVFCEHKGIYGLDRERVILPELYRLFLAASKLQSQEDVKTPRFWEKLRFTTLGDYENFIKWFPASSQKENLRFYWYSSYEALGCGTCDTTPLMKDTLDQYTMIPHDQVKDILDLICQHDEDEKPKPVQLPLVLDAIDNQETNHRCCIFMGQVFYSTKPDLWYDNYFWFDCSLVSYGNHYWALLGTKTLLHRHDIQLTKGELKSGTASWARFCCNDWNNEVDPRINAQLQKDGLEPMRPLVYESGHVHEASNIRHVILPIV